MRYLAVIEAAACVLATVVAATEIAGGAPQRMTPTGLPLALAWSRDYTGAPPISAAVSDGGWLVAGFTDHLEILSIQRGEPMGRLPLPAPHLACDATICVAGDNNAVRAVDLARRTVRWQRATPGPLAFAPTLRSGWVFLTATDGHIAALRDTDGAEVWTFAAGAPLTGPLSVDGDRIAVATANAAITLLDLRTGRPVWTTPLISGTPGTPRLGGGMVYVGAGGRELLFINAADGRVQDTQRIGASVLGAPALDESHVVTGSEDGVLRAFDRSSGVLRWYSDLPTRPASAGPVTEAGLTVIALRSGAFHILLSDGDGKRTAAVFPAPGAGDSTVRLQVPPIIAGAGTSLRLVTISVSVGDTSTWSATVTAAAPPLQLSGVPEQVAGLRLTLTPPR